MPRLLHLCLIVAINGVVRADSRGVSTATRTILPRSQNVRVLSQDIALQVQGFSVPTGQWYAKQN